MLMAQPTETPVRLDTFHNGDTHAAVERLKDSPLVADGKVNVLSLNIIRDTLASRWPARSEQVHDHVARTLARHLGQSGYFFQISDTNFVVVQPRGDRFTAQASCMTYMRALLAHFLGKAAPQNIQIREVTRIGEGGIEAKAVDPNAAGATQSQNVVPLSEARAYAERERTPSRRLLSGTVSELPSRFSWTQNCWTPFVSNDGRKLHVTTHLSPAFRLNGAVEIGAVVGRRIIDTETNEMLGEAERARMSPRDLERIDAATIAGAVVTCRAIGKPMPMLMTPVFYTTLASRRARTTMVARLGQAKSQLGGQLVCEICDLDGAPLDSLYNSCSILRRFCYAVFGQVSEANPRAIGALRGAGFNGLTVRYGGPRDAISLFAELRALVDLCRPVSPKVMAADLEQPQELAIAHLAGATHAAIRHIESAT